MLRPSFKMGEPNIASATRRNKDGLCACHACDNKLDGSSAKFSGLRFCTMCSGKISDMFECIDSATARYVYEGLNTVCR